MHDITPTKTLSIWVDLLRPDEFLTVHCYWFDRINAGQDYVAGIGPEFVLRTAACLN